MPNKEIDITDYFYQKLSYFIIFDEDAEPKWPQFFSYLKQTLFWKIFQRELYFLLSRHCLLTDEVNRIYRFFQILRGLNLDKEALDIMNECIIKLNHYKIDMDIEYYDGFYYTELKKRFPNIRVSNKNIGFLEEYVPSVKYSLAADFPLLWSLIQDDDEVFLTMTLPSIRMEYPFISNIRAFALENPDLFTIELFRQRLQMIIEKWEQEVKEYHFIDGIKVRKKIKEYREYLK